MSEKISGNGQISKISFEGSTSAPKIETSHCAPEKEIKDLDKAHSALVGRSMVKKMQKAPEFDGRIVASVKGDLAALDANYEQNKKAMLLADRAMDRGLSYEEAVKVAQEYLDMQNK